uniref:Uncharacterized protein n=1 Tax=Rhinolophus ferrumequinum TaxID=59479 RepID=A0A671DND8_RHIFE
MTFQHSSCYWRLGSPRSRCELIWFLVRALFLVSRTSLFFLLLLLFFTLLFFHVSSYEGTNPIHVGSTFMT